MITISEQIERLRAIDVENRQFGACSHKHRLGPILLEEECEKIERTYGVSLPEDFRSFITSVGNGGVGPGYGIERFIAAELKDAPLWPTFARAERPKLNTFGRDRLGPVQRFDAAGQLIDEWEFRYFDLAQRYAPDGDFGRECLRRPFSLETPFRVVTDEMAKVRQSNWTPDILSELNCRRGSFSQIQASNGALQIAHYGCGIYAFLVLNGRFRGEVWIYDPTYGDYVPAPMRIDLHIPHHKPKPTQDEPNSEGRPNTCRQVIEEVFQNTRRGHPEERWTFSQWYGNWIELELQTLHLEYTPDAIASRKMAKAEFEQLNSHEHRLVTSGEIAGMKYELLEPSKESL